MAEYPSQTPIEQLRALAQLVRQHPNLQVAWESVRDELLALRAALATEAAQRQQAQAKVAALLDGEQLRLLRLLLSEHDRLIGGKESVVTAAVRAFLAGLAVPTAMGGHDHAERM